MASLTICCLFALATITGGSPVPANSASSSSSAACASFAQQVLNGGNASNVVLLNSTSHAAGSFNISTTYNTYAFCEVNAEVHYTKNDTLQFALWLPDASKYSGSFTAVGNGGMAGSIDYSNMLAQMNSGSAVAGGDSGHRASQNHNGNGAPDTYLPYMHDLDQVQAWIHNAISIFTPVAKQLTAAYYGSSPKYSYYNGCSTGGAQGFALAQLHPELFDGIIAGSPAPWYSHLMLATLWNTLVTNSSETYLPQSILNFTTSKVLDACDALDGVTDRLIEDPLKCKFEIDSLLCTSSAGVNSTCLTAPQLAAAKSIYAGPPVSNVTGEVYPGLSLGSEIEWLGQEQFLSNYYAIPTLQNLALNDLTYNFANFNWNTDIVEVDRNAGRYIDEMSVNLTAFMARGGKMLVTQGWSDPNLSALLPLEYLQRLQQFFSGDVSDFFNVVMIPGGGHCGAASYYPSVPATYHTVPALVDWVENGVKPTEILSTDPPDHSNRTRKLCVWPQTAVYMSGDVDDWTSYKCQGSS